MIKIKLLLLLGLLLMSCAVRQVAKRPPRTDNSIFEQQISLMADGYAVRIDGKTLNWSKKWNLRQDNELCTLRVTPVLQDESPK